MAVPLIITFAGVDKEMVIDPSSISYALREGEKITVAFKNLPKVIEINVGPAEECLRLFGAITQAIKTV